MEQHNVYFNTTLVSVRHKIHIFKNRYIFNFNTTLVSVRLFKIAIKCLKYCQISIQHLFRFDSKNFRQMDKNRYFNTTLVSVRLFGWFLCSCQCFISIQHLFRFDSYLKGFRVVYDVISIQHLFRFDVKMLDKRIKLTSISIQHLFRFDKEKKSWLSLSAPFQYNTCFGSTAHIARKLLFPKDFNTTLVSVRP